MSLLSALLPGLRELRAPTAAGTVWALALILLIPRYAALSARSLEELAQRIPAELHIPLVLGGVYVLGVVAVGLQHTASKLVRDTVSKILQRLGSSKTLRNTASHVWRRVLPRSRFARIISEWLAVESRLVSPPALTTIESAIKERARRLSGTLANLIPVELVLDEFELAALRLSKEAPDQYQQYDRLRAEAEFRQVLVPPIVVFGIVVAAEQPTALGLTALAAFIAVGVLLASQSADQRHRAQELLASAIYFEMTTTPLLEALIREYGAFPAKEADHLADSNADWLAVDLPWFLNFLDSRGLLYVYGQQSLSRLRHPSTPPPLLREVAARLSPSARWKVEQALGARVEEWRESESPGPEAGRVAEDT